jgi:monoamine oxidase
MGPRAKPPFTLVGFASGSRADRLATLPHAELARLLCAQLDAIFGTATRPHPASHACTAHLVKDWAQAPHARGAYSYPTPTALGSRSRLCAPLQGRLFFCGEACHEGINPCVHGAMETGERAAEQAAASLKRGERQAEAAEGARSRL